MHPVFNKWFFVGSDALSNLILVMRKDKIVAAGMNIEIFTEMFAAHSRAFDVPAGSAVAPFAFPGRLSFFCFFPEGKVERIFFLLINFNPRARFQIIYIFPAQLSIAVKFGYIKKYITINVVSVPFFFKCFNHLQNVIHMVCRSRIDVRFPKFEPCYIFKKCIDIFSCNIIAAYFFFNRFFNNLVVYIGKIHNELHFVITVFKISSYDLCHYKRARVAYVKIIVNGRTAHIHSNFRWIYGFECFFFLR